MTNNGIMAAILDKFMIFLLWISVSLIKDVESYRRRNYLEQSVLDAHLHEKREKFERLQYKYEQIYTKRIRGKMSPFFKGDPRITDDTSWLMGYDGKPYGFEMLIIIFLPLFAAKGLSLLMENVEPLPPCMDKAPKLPYISLFHHQSTAVERELKRPLRSGIIWYAKHFLIRADDEIIDRKHIRYLIDTHQKINMEASRNPWHTLRMLLRIKQLNKKASAFSRNMKPDVLQTFLDGFTEAMELNTMHQREETAFLDRLQQKQKASELHLKSKLVQVKAKENLEQHKEVKYHYDVKRSALYHLRDKAIEAQKRKVEEKKDELKVTEKMLKWEKKQAAKDELQAKRKAILTERQASIVDLEISEQSASSSSDTDSNSSADTVRSAKPEHDHGHGHSETGNADKKAAAGKRRFTSPDIRPMTMATDAPAPNIVRDNRPTGDDVPDKKLAAGTGKPIVPVQEAAAAAADADAAQPDMKLKDNHNMERKATIQEIARTRRLTLADVDKYFEEYDAAQQEKWKTPKTKNPPEKLHFSQSAPKNPPEKLHFSQSAPKNPPEKLHFSQSAPKKPAPKRDRNYDIAKSGFQVPKYIHGVYTIDDPENLLHSNKKKK